MRMMLRWFGILLTMIGIGTLAGLLYWNANAAAGTVEAQVEMRELLTTTTTNSDSTTTSLVDRTTSGANSDDPTFEAPEGWGAQELAPSTPEPTLPPPELGTPIGILTIEALDFEWVVVEGVGVPELKLGPGHMPWTPMPGTEGNATISGHRTTYGAPFHDLHLLEAGDEITYADADGKATVYEVTEIIIVSPSDVWVTEDRGEGKLLTLTTCNPIGSARERLIVFAKSLEG